MSRARIRATFFCGAPCRTGARRRRGRKHWMAVAAIETPQSLITWRYLWWALTAIAATIAAIVPGNPWLLNFIHVFSSLLWTGIDLFMGFVLGPILRRVDLSVRREIVRRLTPRTLFLMPTVSIISCTTGWSLAVVTRAHAMPW